jgi:hypothetical protein
MLSSQLTVGFDPAAATINFFEKLTTNLTGVYVGHPPELFIYYIKNHFYMVSIQHASACELYTQILLCV